MHPAQLILIGFCLGIGGVFLFAMCCNGKTEPDPERRSGTEDRRRRMRTRAIVAQIQRDHASESITLPQATHRLREVEAPAEAAFRVAG